MSEAGVNVQREVGILLCLIGHGKHFGLHFKCPATQLNACVKKIPWAAM